jgi:hypothetical protein
MLIQFFDNLETKPPTNLAFILTSNIMVDPEQQNRIHGQLLCHVRSYQLYL